MDSDRQEPGTTVPLTLTRAERTLGVLAVFAAAAAGGFGFAQSFEAVSMWGAGAGFLHGWMLPLTVDLLIPSFGILSCLFIRLGMEYRLLRWAPLAMTAATVYLNVNTGSRLSYQVAHGLTAGVFALVTEVGMHYYRAKSGVESGTRMGRIRLTRWILSPFRTFAMWRRMVLWEITDYRQAIELERRRLLAIADLEETYGRHWKREAPARVMVGLKLGLTPRQDDPVTRVPTPRAATSSAPVTQVTAAANSVEKVAAGGSESAHRAPSGDHPGGQQGRTPVVPPYRPVTVQPFGSDVGARDRFEQPQTAARSAPRAVAATVAHAVVHETIARPVPEQVAGHAPQPTEAEEIDSAERLRRIRQAKIDGLSQRKAARLAQCSPSYVRKVWDEAAKVAAAA